MSDNDKTTWRVTIKSAEGQPLVTFLVEGERVAATPPEPAASSSGNSGPNHPVPETDGEPRMTDPQKRYLFRLLAEKGVEGKKAEDHLRDHFKVRALREVSKAAASQLIEQMVAERKEAAGGTA